MCLASLKMSFAVSWPHDDIEEFLSQWTDGDVTDQIVFVNEQRTNQPFNGIKEKYNFRKSFKSFIFFNLNVNAKQHDFQTAKQLQLVQFDFKRKT